MWRGGVVFVVCGSVLSFFLLFSFSVGGFPFPIRSLSHPWHGIGMHGTALGVIDIVGGGGRHTGAFYDEIWVVGYA